MGWRDWQARRLALPETQVSDTWRSWSDDAYTCVAPPGFEKDPAVTAAIREFDPGAIPLWRVQVWMPPGHFESIRVVHHGIGRYYPFPRYQRRRFHVELPQGWAGEAPNFLDVIFEDPEKTKWTGPAAYIPWDWSVYRWCRLQYEALTVPKYMERVERKREAKRKAREQARAELEYRTRHFEQWVMPRLAGITEADWAAYQAKVASGQRDRKVYVGLHGAAPREGRHASHQ